MNNSQKHSNVEIIRYLFVKVKQARVLKRESKKSEVSKIPSLLNVDQNREKQEVNDISLLVPKTCHLEFSAYLNMTKIKSNLEVSTEFHRISF